MQANKVTLEFLDAFAEAFNQHDVDGILSFMTDDPVFEASAGTDIKGQVARGRDAVRRAFQDVFDTFSDARWSDPKHFVAGDRAVSEWVFSGTRKDGTRVEVQGCDILMLKRRQDRN